MLIEIQCCKFKQKIVKFTPGLNAVVGDADGANSIGKSTFLMILDFVYGGDDYLKQKDIFDEIGHHEIKFSFSFNDDVFYFKRSTEEANVVVRCKIGYEDCSAIDIKEYRLFLQNSYNLEDSLSFREVVGRFSRVYGKQNCNEKNPLSIVDKEKEENIVRFILKIFCQYSTIESYLKKIASIKEKIKAAERASSYNWRPLLKKKRERNSNDTRIADLSREIEELKIKVLGNVVELTTEQCEQISLLKNNLSVLNRRRSFIVHDIQRIRNNTSSHSLIAKQSLKDLEEFFPDADIARIEEINAFHTTVKDLVKNEIKKSIKRLESQLPVLDLEIKKTLDKIAIISKINQADSAASLALNRMVELKEQLIKAEAQKKYSTEYAVDKESENKYAAEYMEKLQQCLADIGNELNQVMACINSQICDSSSPVITIGDKKYSLETPSDSGTGTRFKGMIVLDLSFLKLTKVPYLIHDSLLFKNIEDASVDGIMAQYNSQSKKQVFIALDKIGTYFLSTQSIIAQSVVLCLAAGEGALFGRAWSRK